MKSGGCVNWGEAGKTVISLRRQKGKRETKTMLLIKEKYGNSDEMLYKFLL